ncbi:MAG: hypothetical protein Q9M33_06180, partial [Robiginitomaculum sp.]|nr:hypothetical protein [Robiginitomaculum sp.]
MLRKILLTSVALPLFGFASIAVAQVELTDERTTPVTTGTIDGGSPGDIIIRSGASILVGAGNTAVTIDTDNTVTNEGTIGSADANNTTGILISGGTTGGFTNTGVVDLNEDYTPVDSDEDGDVDGPFAIGTGRTGVLVEGSSPFNGNITNATTGRITVEGNDSAGVRILAGLNGNLINNGNITITGNDGYGIQVDGTVNGDITNAGAIVVKGTNSVGLGIDAAVNGTVTNTGQISVTGFRETTRRNNADDRAKLDADDLGQGGSAVAIAASISGGFLNGAQLDDAGNTVRTGEIFSQGSAPAILIAAGQSGTPDADVVLGKIGAAADNQDYGLVNTGTISAAGINDG